MKNKKQQYSNQEAVARRCSVRKGILRNSLTQMFSCNFCEISKNSFSHKTPPVAASVNTGNNGATG